MTGIMIRSGVKITGTGHRKLYPDRRMSEGSLLLLDLSNQSVDQPINLTAGTLIPNIAHKQAAAMLGVGDLPSLSSVISNNTNDVTSKAEITAKKGIHTITGQTGTGHILGIGIPDLIKTYMLTNSSHDYFFALAYKVTRAGVGTSSDYYRFRVVNNGAATSNYNMLIRKVDYRPSPTQNPSNLLGYFADPATRDNDGLHYIDMAVSDWSGTKPTVIASMGAGYGVRQAEVSEILYDLYIEDLTVSGRTYAQASTACRNVFIENFAEGGKFYNDVFTDPATIA